MDWEIYVAHKCGKYFEKETVDEWLKKNKVTKVILRKKKTEIPKGTFNAFTKKKKKS